MKYSARIVHAMPPGCTTRSRADVNKIMAEVGQALSESSAASDFLAKYRARNPHAYAVHDHMMQRCQHDRLKAAGALFIAMAFSLVLIALAIIL